MRNVLQREVRIDRSVINAAIDSGILEQRADLRCEPDSIPVLCPEERLLPDPIARTEETARTNIPNRKREHSPKAVHHLVAILLVEMNENLRIASRREAMAEAQELIPQSQEVIDLAVHDNDDGPVLVENRLVTAGDVDDRESPDAKPSAVSSIDAERVGTSMLDHSTHTVKDALVDSSAEVDLSHNPAHRLSLLDQEWTTQTILGQAKSSLPLSTDRLGRMVPTNVRSTSRGALAPRGTTIPEITR